MSEVHQIDTVLVCRCSLPIRFVCCFQERLRHIRGAFVPLDLPQASPCIIMDMYVFKICMVWMTAGGAKPALKWRLHLRELDCWAALLRWAHQAPASDAGVTRERLIQVGLGIYGQK